MWVYRTGRLNQDKHIILYEYQLSRAVKAMPKAAREQSLAYLALKQIQAIHQEENKLFDMEPNERLKHRQLTVKLLVAAYFV